MKLIVANWKMNGSLKLLQECLDKWPSDSLTNQVVMCLPFVFLRSASAFLKHPFFALGGQDCHPKLSGPFTGDISAYHLQEVGCRYVIVGHSERRYHHQESDELIRAKAQAALNADLVPIICIGETLDQREQGITLDILSEQISASLPVQPASVCVAYEPVWAIGTGKTPALEDIANIHAFLRQSLGDTIPLLYGGSVTVDNHASILDLQNVDGLLVGGASLKINDFSTIIHYAN